MGKVGVLKTNCHHRPIRRHSGRDHLLFCVLLHMYVLQIAHPLQDIAGLCSTASSSVLVCSAKV